MTELYFMNSANNARSSLLSWQKQVYESARHYEHTLFTREGIQELAGRLQKQADGLRGRDRDVHYTYNSYFDDPFITIGQGCSLSFTRVRGAWAEMKEGEL